MTRKRHVDCLWNEELCLKITECIVNVVVPIFSSIQTLKWDFGLSTVVTINFNSHRYYRVVLHPFLFAII